MKYITYKEIFLSVLILALSFCLLNPLHLFMPGMIQKTILGLLLICAGLFTGLIVHEQIEDERELDHHNKAGRFGYTLGVIFILFGIVYQTIYMPYDPWLIVALVAMVLGKVVSRVWLRIYR